MQHPQKFFSYIALLLLTASTGYTIELYKWVDADGVVHFSNIPPVDTKDQNMEIISFEGPPLIESYPETEEAKQATTLSVAIYTTARCGYCRQAKAYMSEKGIAYTEYNIENSEANRTAFRQLGGQGVPLMVIGQYRMNGFSPQSFDSLLKRAGY